MWMYKCFERLRDLSVCIHVNMHVLTAAISMPKRGQILECEGRLLSLYLHSELYPCWGDPWVLCLTCDGIFCKPCCHPGMFNVCALCVSIVCAMCVCVLHYMIYVCFLCMFPKLLARGQTYRCRVLGNPCSCLPAMAATATEPQSETDQKTPRNEKEMVRQTCIPY